MKVLFTYDYGKENMDKVRALGYDAIYIDEKNIQNSKEINDIDMLICYNPFQTLDVSQMKNLKFVQLSSIGVDQAPLKYLKENNITLINNKGGYSIPMGEWIVLKILEIYKNSKKCYERQANKDWKIDTTFMELYGKKIGFLGTGSIAKEASKRLKGFEVDIYGLNTYGKEIENFDKCFSLEEIDLFLSKCDVVVVVLPYTKQTHHFMDYDKFSKMKDKSIFINIARGSIVNEKDLIKIIKEDKFLGVALDVYEIEPLPKESPLWDLEKVSVSCHNSWISEMRNKRRFSIIYENLKRLKNNETLKNIVDIDKGY